MTSRKMRTEKLSEVRTIRAVKVMEPMPLGVTRGVKSALRKKATWRCRLLRPTVIVTLQRIN
jgi:hypothetical protein